MASADAISISMIIIGVPNTAGMAGITCRTVRSGVTTSVRSARMPALMTSRASKEDVSALLLRGALDESLAALHLVGQRRLVDLDHDGVGIDAEVLHQRLGDVAHHTGLLVIGAARGHADGNFRHCCLLVLFSFRHGRACP